MQWTMKELMKKFDNNFMEMKSDLLSFKQKGIFEFDMPLSQITEESTFRISFDKEAFYKALNDESFLKKLHFTTKEKESC